MTTLRGTSRVARVAAATTIVFALAACTSSPEAVSEPAGDADVVVAGDELGDTGGGGASGECMTVMAQVEVDLHRHYDEWAGDYSDAEEQAWQAVMEPIYDACDGPVDMMDAFKAYPYAAGVTSAQFVDAFWLEAFCYSRATAPSCVGYEDVLDDYR